MNKRLDIAITGIACRFPKAGNVSEFWNNLTNGADCIDVLSQTRTDDLSQYLNAIGQSCEIGGAEAGLLDRIDLFDYSYFNITPMEANLMDPAQRLFLETAWLAIEDAGYGKEAISGADAGVFVGYVSDSDYKTMIRDTQPHSLSLALPGNARPLIAGRLSRILDLKGPNMLIDTGCSSSLAAVHAACQAIWNGECGLALAGGVQIHVIPLREGSIGVESSNGRTRAFDDNSDGTGTGEGVAAIFLKPLDKALADKDNIYAVIKGSAINHDGRSIGVTAPNAPAQSAVITRAWEAAGIDPTSIGYIEAHGTGTKLGDVIEAEGLRLAFSKHTDKTAFCAIGSVKSNIGHTDGCAGLAGLIKAALQLYHKTLVPSIHCNTPNTNINWANMPVYVNKSLVKWVSPGVSRICGVSSFSLSGTNCHVVLQEAPERETQKPPSPGYAFKPVRCWLTYKENTTPETRMYNLKWELNHYSRAAFLPKKHGSVLLKGRDSKLKKDLAACLETLGIDVVNSAPHGKNIERIIYAGDEDSFNDNLDDFYDFIAAFGGLDIQTTVLTRYGWNVTGMEEHISPVNASLLGLGLGVYYEYPRLRVRLIDIDDNTPFSSIIRDVCQENVELRTAYRNNLRFTPALKEITAGLRADINLSAQKKTYLITGGSGGIGMEIARYFSQKDVVNLCLVARTDENDPNITRELSNLRRAGSKVTYISADISDFGQLKSALEEFNRQYGKIDGVFHCAGIAGKGFLSRMRKEDILAAMRAKALGAEHIYKLLTPDPPDFIILFSSLASIVGGYAQSGYIAANAYLDAMAACYGKNGPPVMTINWPAWRGVGMASRLENAPENKTGDIFDSIGVETGLALLNIAACNIGDISQAIICNIKRASAHNTNTIGLNNICEEVKAAVSGKRLSTDSAIPRVTLFGRDGGDYTETERKLAKIWNKTLGFTEFNIYDDFFELGGDSFMIGGILDMLDETFAGEMAISDLFLNTTIYLLAKFIDGKHVKEQTE